MDETRYTSGQIADSTGLTIRAVQYYDRIGLLPSSGRTKNGRRYYTQDDLIMMEQIVLYKSLGFSLEQVKKNILPNPNKDELLEMFGNQKLMLMQKLEHLHTALSIVGIMADRIEAGKEPLIHVLLRFLNALPDDDIFSQASTMITREQHQSLSRYFQEIEPLQTFYHAWKELLIDAIVLIHEDILPDSVSAQDLAERWYEAILSITNGDLNVIKEISELHLEKQLPTRDRETFETANYYMGQALEIYIQKNSITLFKTVEP